MIAETVKPYHVLLVEDDLGDALLIEEALAASDAAPSLDKVEDGVAALGYLQDPGSPRPDLIVLDLNMPRMSGAELLTVIKHDEALRAIPVVVLTTSNAPDDITAAYREYASAYVVKPITLDDFTAAVQNIDLFYRENTARLPEN